MKKKKELKYLKKLFKKKQLQFKCFVHTQSPEALHGFRVQIKKIRSFLTLLEAGNKNDKLLKTFKTEKRLFRSTSVIRDAYIHQKQAKENHINAPQLYKAQDALQQKETGKLIGQQAKLLHKMKKVKQRLRHRINVISKNEIEQFFATQIRDVEQLLNSHNFSEQLHNGRKILKHLLYNRQIIPHVVAKNMSINYDEIDAIQQVIGDWHDNKVALDFFSNKLPAKTLETIRQKQEELKKTITEKADSLLKHRL